MPASAVTVPQWVVGCAASVALTCASQRQTSVYAACGWRPSTAGFALSTSTKSAWQRSTSPTNVPGGACTASASKARSTSLGPLDVAGTSGMQATPNVDVSTIRVGSQAVAVRTTESNAVDPAEDPQ